MRKLIPFMLLLVAACVKDERATCMAPNESGEVVAVQSDNSTYGGRGGPYFHFGTIVTLKMRNGVSRVCSVGDSQPEMFPKGLQINLSTGKRAF